MFDRIILHYYGPSDLAQLDLVSHTRDRLNCLNRSTLLAGLVMGYSTMATGCFRFAESFIYHNLAAAGVFLVTPFYMAVHVYFSAVFAGAVNTARVYCARLVMGMTGWDCPPWDKSFNT